MNIPLTPICFLERSVKVYGEKTGVIHREHRVSYKASRGRVNQLSNTLLKAGVNKEAEKWGEIHFAFVVPKDGSPIKPQEIIAFSREKLAHFKAPKEVKIISELPPGGTGKILKALLRKEFQ